MKYIWLLCRAYYPNIGGIETSIYEMSKAFCRLGYKVIILTQEPEILNFEQREEVATVEHYVDRRDLFSRIVIPLRVTYRRQEIRKKIEELKGKYGVPEWVIARDPLMAVQYYRIIGNNITYIPPAIIAYDYENKNKKKLRNTIIARILMKYEQYYQEYCFRRFDKVIVFSNNVKAQIMRRIRSSRDNVIVIYPGCNVDKAYIDAYQYNLLTVRLLFVGRIVEDKNLWMLVKAIQLIKQSNVVLDIVGDGDQREEIEEYVKKNKVEGVKFHGFQYETSKFYSNADYTMMPSKYESFGQAITESLYHGTPVIGFKTIQGSTLTAIEELIEDGVTGFIIDEFSADALAKAINKAINLKKKENDYKKMRNLCGEYAKNTFDWDVFAKQCIAVLASPDSIRNS